MIVTGLDSCISENLRCDASQALKFVARIFMSWHAGALLSQTIFHSLAPHNEFPAVLSSSSSKHVLEARGTVFRDSKQRLVSCRKP